MAIRGPPAKGLVRGLPEARVRISLSPPNKRLSYNRQSFILWRNEIRTQFCGKQNATLGPTHRVLFEKMCKKK